MSAKSPGRGDPSTLVFPMHGFHKMRDEGFRTRDAHIIEWLSRLSNQPVEIMSRPDPVLLDSIRRIGKQRVGIPSGMVVHNSTSSRIPHLGDRRRWWVDSASQYDAPFAGDNVPAIVWNPFVALSNIRNTVFNKRRQVVADLLDDWSAHYAFEGISRHVDEAYAALFGEADFVVANGEGTAELARRYGRDDVKTIFNGVDPSQFDAISHASGPTTVGYVGKIGRRVDLDLVLTVTREVRDARFVFAGPILDREYRRPLAAEPNIDLLGDVHYSKVPSLLSSFDVGWVPHRVGEYEVGGDVIKSYEYRAAGLVVLSTPLRGTENRSLPGVHVLPANQHADWLRRIATRVRVPRETSPIPSKHTWRGKAEALTHMIW